MAKLWFYSQGCRKISGPCSSAALRKLAATGQVTPDDMVRGGRMARPVKAGRIKGLFVAPAP